MSKEDYRIKALKSASKTKCTKEVVSRHGDGGFQVVHLPQHISVMTQNLDRAMLAIEVTCLMPVVVMPCSTLSKVLLRLSLWIRYYLLFIRMR